VAAEQAQEEEEEKLAQSESKRKREVSRYCGKVKFLLFYYTFSKQSCGGI